MRAIFFLRMHIASRATTGMFTFRLIDLRTPALGRLEARTAVWPVRRWTTAALVAIAAWLI
ncbi:MAG: hypothetical protein NVSMB44_04190 [Ktedonobacteraceae bacterium]